MPQWGEVFRADPPGFFSFVLGGPLPPRCRFRIRHGELMQALTATCGNFPKIPALLPFSHRIRSLRSRQEGEMMRPRRIRSTAFVYRNRNDENPQRMAGIRHRGYPVGKDKILRRSWGGYVSAVPFAWLKSFRFYIRGGLVPRPCRCRWFLGFF